MNYNELIKIRYLVDTISSIPPTLTDVPAVSLQWRHNGHDGVSNQQPCACLLNRRFGRRSKKTLKFRVTGLCEGNSRTNGTSREKCYHLMMSLCSRTMVMLTSYIILLHPGDRKHANIMGKTILLQENEWHLWAAWEIHRRIIALLAELTSFSST